MINVINLYDLKKEKNNHIIKETYHRWWVRLKGVGGWVVGRGSWVGRAFWVKASSPPMQRSILTDLLFLDTVFLSCRAHRFAFFPSCLPDSFTEVGRKLQVLLDLGVQAVCRLRIF